MKRYIDMTREEMEAYKRDVGFFFSANVVWIDTDGKQISSDYDCTTIRELNECISNNKKAVYVNRFIRHIGTNLGNRHAQHPTLTPEQN